MGFTSVSATWTARWRDSETEQKGGSTPNTFFLLQNTDGEKKESNHAVRVKRGMGTLLLGMFQKWENRSYSMPILVSSCQAYRVPLFFVLNLKVVPLDAELCGIHLH